MIALYRIFIYLIYNLTSLKINQFDFNEKLFIFLYLVFKKFLTLSLKNIINCHKKKKVLSFLYLTKNLLIIKFFVSF